ncbi:hypothetical protein GGR57DRAFT_510218 [Xylariaceae sp. FL1272]|nr:hypothetical protein GGR57DRAFT_510218 [Xylariaceae sp. FL1272]
MLKAANQQPLANAYHGPQGYGVLIPNDAQPEAAMSYRKYGPQVYGQLTPNNGQPESVTSSQAHGPQVDDSQRLIPPVQYYDAQPEAAMSYWKYGPQVYGQLTPNNGQPESVTSSQAHGPRVDDSQRLIPPVQYYDAQPGPATSSRHRTYEFSYTLAPMLSNPPPAFHPTPYSSHSISNNERPDDDRYYYTHDPDNGYSWTDQDDHNGR